MADYLLPTFIVDTGIGPGRFMVKSLAGILERDRQEAKPLILQPALSIHRTSAADYNVFKADLTQSLDTFEAQQGTPADQRTPVTLMAIAANLRGQGFDVEERPLGGLVSRAEITPMSIPVVLGVPLLQDPFRKDPWAYDLSLPLSPPPSRSTYTNPLSLSKRLGKHATPDSTDTKYKA